jgi:hypothetical protein
MGRNEKRSFLWILFGIRRHDDEVSSEDQELPSGKNITYPYKVNDRFLTLAEHSFYLVAQKVLGDQYCICPQVPLSAIFYVSDPNANHTPFNRIARKRVDFIVCDAVTMKINFGIELDDSSHRRKERVERDEFVNQVFERANLPLVHIDTKAAYHTGELMSLFEKALGLKMANQTLGQQIVSQSQSPTPSQPVEKSCPNCGATMVIRTSVAGPNVGSKFYVCKNYPACKTSIKID